MAQSAEQTYVLCPLNDLGRLAVTPSLAATLIPRETLLLVAVQGSTGSRESHLEQSQKQDKAREKATLDMKHYLGPVVEVIHTRGIHEGLVEVGAGVNPSGDHQFPGGVNHLGPARNHELTAHLLDDAVLNVDIRLVGTVIVHHLASLDENPHTGRIGKHVPVDGKWESG